MIYVLRNGKLVEKRQALLFDQAEMLSQRINEGLHIDLVETLCKPFVSRFEAMESPVTGKGISSWRERDKDMNAANAVDPRDIPKAAFEKRKQLVERNARSGSDD